MLDSPIPHVATPKVETPTPRPQKPVTQWFAEWKARKSEAASAAKGSAKKG